MLQLFLDSTPSVPLLRKPFLIKPRYEIDIAKRNGNQKHPRTFHFSRAQEKPFRAPKVPRGTKKPIPVALKPIPGTKKQIPGHQKHRPEQKNTTGTKKTNPGKMTPREGKTPFREQKTRSPARTKELMDIFQSILWSDASLSIVEDGWSWGTGV